MNFEILSTQRLLLRKLRSDELNFIFENNTEDEIRKELGITNDEEYLKEKEKFRKGYSANTKPFLKFQLIDKLSKEIIGGCGFHNWFADHKRAEIGYVILKEEFKGKGLMTEAMKPILDYGFNTMNLNRVEACLDPDNMASLKLLMKYNFTREGYLRRHYFKDNIYYDSLLFSLLRDEFKS